MYKAAYTIQLKPGVVGILLDAAPTKKDWEAKAISINGASYSFKRATDDRSVSINTNDPPKLLIGKEIVFI